jgi:hypothetical protein
MQWGSYNLAQEISSSTIFVWMIQSEIWVVKDGLLANENGIIID